MEVGSLDLDFSLESLEPLEQAIQLKSHSQDQEDKKMDALFIIRP